MLLKTFREDSFCLCVLVFLILSKIYVEIISLNFYVFLDNVQFIYSAFDFRTGNTWTISKIQITSGCMYFLFSLDLLHIYDGICLYGPFNEISLSYILRFISLVLIQYKVCTFILYVYLFKTLSQSIKKSVEQTKCA